MERCERCGGRIEEVPKGSMTIMGLSEYCYCRFAMVEALESTARMLEKHYEGWLEANSSFVGQWNDAYRSCLRGALDLIRQHRPWEKPASPKPKVSRKAVEQAVASSEGPRPIPGSPMFNRLMDALSAILDLED